jgi:hypothetical protein
MPILSIVYVSSASRPLSRPELDALRDSWARVFNGEGITGLVLYRDGSFMAYIEGEPDRVLRTFDAVRRHPAHHDVTEMQQQRCEAREFSEMTMTEKLPEAIARTTSSGERPGAALLRAMWG